MSARFGEVACNFLIVEQSLMQLLRRRFSPGRLAGDWLQVLST